MTHVNQFFWSKRFTKQHRTRCESWFTTLVNQFFWRRQSKRFTNHDTTSNSFFVIHVQMTLVNQLFWMSHTKDPRNNLEVKELLVSESSLNGLWVQSESESENRSEPLRSSQPTSSQKNAHFFVWKEPGTVTRTNFGLVRFILIYLLTFHLTMCN